MRVLTDYAVLYLWCLASRHRISQIIALEVPLLVDGQSIYVIILLCITLFIPPNVAPNMFILRVKPYGSAGLCLASTLAMDLPATIVQATTGPKKPRRSQ